MQSKDSNPSNEPAAESNVRPNSAKILGDMNNKVNPSRRGEVGASIGNYTTRYSLRQQRESILSSEPRRAHNQAQSRSSKVSAAESRSPKSYPESNDDSSDPEQVRDSGSEDTELYAPVATTGSRAMDDSLNPAAAQLVVDLRAPEMRQIDPHATMPIGEDAGHCGQITHSSKSSGSKTRSPSVLPFKQKAEPNPSKPWISISAPRGSNRSNTERNDFSVNFKNMAAINMSGDIQRLVCAGFVVSDLSAIAELGLDFDINHCCPHIHLGSGGVLFSADLARCVGLGHPRQRNRSLDKGYLLLVLA